MKLNSHDAATYNDLAWLLATREAAQGGDPRRAVPLAEQACKLTDNKSYACLDTLAIAYAAAGRFAEAIATAQKAMALASAAGETLAVKHIEARLGLYKERHPYREPTAGTGRNVREGGANVGGNRPQNPCGSQNWQKRTPGGCPG